MLGGQDADSDEEKGRKPSKGQGKGRRSSSGGTNSHSRGSSSMHEFATKSSTKDLVDELPEDFEPGEYDVVCSRGKWAMNAPGNVRYRNIIKENLQRYSETTTKQEKSTIVSEIVESIQALSPEGGFVRSVNGRWYTVTDHIAREKTGQSFRDLLHTQYRSSTKAKRRRQKEKGTTEVQHATPAVSKGPTPPPQQNQAGTIPTGIVPNHAFSMSSVASQVFPNVPNHTFNGNMMVPPLAVHPQVGPNGPLHTYPGNGLFTGPPTQHHLPSSMYGINHNGMAFPGQNTNALQPHHPGQSMGYDDFGTFPMLHPQQQQHQHQPQYNYHQPQHALQMLHSGLPPTHSQELMGHQPQHLPNSGTQQPLHRAALPPDSPEQEPDEQLPSRQSLRQQSLEPIPLHEAQDHHHHPTLLDIGGTSGDGKSDSFEGILGSDFAERGRHDHLGESDQDEV